MTGAKMASDLFMKEKQVAPLRIIALSSAKELGDKINYYLTEWSKGTSYEQERFLVPAECQRFSSGERA